MAQGKDSFSGRLTHVDMDILEELIGNGPKRFTLLYAITRDGCNGTAFHQKCDDQGPTVTILYNSQGSVYGGYASLSWKSQGLYQKAENSFLFQLYYSDNRKISKFLLKDSSGTNAVYFDSVRGPDFGIGDLETFSNLINNTDGYFALDGKVCGGNIYDFHGIEENEINNGNMNVTELEVYRVEDDVSRKQLVPEQWRKTSGFSSALLTELKESVCSFEAAEEVGVKETRILMIGPVGAGKSSLCNTITSVFRGRISRKACSGSAEQSLTTAYTPYKVRCKSAEHLKFRLCDTRGLVESSGLSDVECNYLLDGNIPDYYQFGDTPISPKTTGFKSSPSAADQIHCAVFVLDATTLNVLSPKLVEKMKGFQKLMNSKEIPQLVVLTKIDLLCADVQKDISMALRSSIVKQHVDKAAQILGLPRGNILPVKNYENEAELNENIDILVLLALREILNSAEDFIENMYDKNTDLQS